MRAFAVRETKPNMSLGIIIAPWMSAFPVKRAFADTLGSFGLGLARTGIFLDHESGVFHSSPQVIRLAAIMHFLTQIRRERIVIRRG
jgi:hypothetical protein